MKFDKSKVYTAVNADEVKVGSKGYFANRLSRLRQIVEEGKFESFGMVDFIYTDDYNYCFQYADIGRYHYFYLIEEPVSEIKEVTAAEWDNRPRIMKVWDSDYSEAKERKVVYIVPEEYRIDYPVICVSKDGGSHLVNFKHCAEIETTQELEAEKRYRPYNNAEEFISDYKKRFCPDYNGIPAIWIKNKADVLKLVTYIMDKGVRVKDSLITYESLLDVYNYPDDTYCGIEEVEDDAE